MSREKELEARLAAAEKTIEVLLERIGREEERDRASLGDASRAIAGLEGILRRRSRALEESEARYRALFDQSPDMVLTVDERGRITEANARSAEILGDLVEDQTTLDELFDDDNAAEVLHSVLSGPAGGVLGELNLVDGRRVSIMASSIPALEGLSQVVLRDISARRALEEELGQSRRLAAVGHLAAGVAHEINNPLAVLRLRLDALGELPMPVFAAGPLEVMGRQVDRIARIVRSLQSFAKKQSLHREDVRVRDIIEGALEASAAGIGATDVHLDVSPTLWVSGDRTQLEQVVSNLVLNASRAMNYGGDIHITASIDDARVCIEVSDEGPGVPPEVQADLFTPFVSGSAEGTGLGLAICWSIVDEHGGALTWENAPEGGACFSVCLPRSPGEPVWADVTSEPTSQGLLVLVVDDEPEIRNMVEAFLAAAGHRSLLAPSAEDALRIIASRDDLDVLVTDIHLPGRSGLDLLHELEDRRHPLANRAVIMSGLFHRPEQGTPYLQKPFRRSSFLAALDEVLER
ncbi:MAG: hybrid sensor histidine kinase/response regulator [Deltaproteobacteria bacterium]|nr:MAG: hybrid sensor histidine kinase/response regulator [Deltaproteobacteria bacterium]